MCFAWNGTAADSFEQYSCGEHGLQRNQRVIHVDKLSTIAGFFLGEPVQAKLKKPLQNDPELVRSRCHKREAKTSYYRLRQNSLKQHIYNVNNNKKKF